MTNRCILIGMITVLSAVLIIPGLEAAESKRPNIVFLLSDDINRDSWGVYGNPDCKTPNIDRLASEGMRFDHAYCAVAMCAPFRQELYSGCTPWRTGTLANHSKSKKDTQSIPHYLKPLGYRTALLGKTHIGPKQAYPFEYLGDGPKGKDCNDLYMDRAEKFIDSAEKEKKPFCLFIASNDGHAPHTTGDPSAYPPDKLTVAPYWYDTPQLRNSLSKYYAEVTNFDALVGRVVAALKKRNLLDDTIVLVCSEQGIQFPFAKWTCFDNGLHTALVARYPGMIKPGSRCGELVAIADVCPTLVELAGGTLKPGDVDGRSFVSFLKGENTPIHKYVFGAFTNCNIIDNRSRIYPIRSIRSKEYTLLYCPNYKGVTSNVTLTEALGMVEGKNKAATAGTIAGSWVVAGKDDPRAAFLTKRLFHHPEYSFFSRSNDPYEEKNLADKPECQTVFNEMKAALLKKLEALGDSDPIKTEKSICKGKKK